MQETLQAILAALTMSAAAARAAAERFRSAMADGLVGAPSPLKMLPSYAGVPAGTETGCYLALDFGGTNVRALRVELRGRRNYRVLARRSAPLRLAGRYDYTDARARAEDLFDFLAELVGAAARPGEPYLLGHTFSFPARQAALNEARLIMWTKEFATAGVVGRDVNGLLAAALRRRGLARIRPVAVINDTVGALLTAAYENPNADIASICGTGHNTAYVERRAGGGATIVNLEAGGFDCLPFTKYDDELDAASDKPGAQRLEKMVGGRYLGELARLAARDLRRSGGFAGWPDDFWDAPGGLRSEDLAALLSGGAPDFAAARLQAPAAADIRALREIARTIVDRAAKLAAATYSGVLLHADPALARLHHIAVDGSLYDKMPGFAAAVQAGLAALWGGRARRIRVAAQRQGSGVGAALAAALAARET